MKPQLCFFLKKTFSSLKPVIFITLFYIILFFFCSVFESASTYSTKEIKHKLRLKETLLNVQLYQDINFSVT